MMMSRRFYRVCGQKHQCKSARCGAACPDRFWPWTIKFENSARLVPRGGGEKFFEFS
jgi:hypothetical protein